MLDRAEPRSVILVVDDEEKIRQMIGEQLEEGGYEVLLASSGDDAFEILRTDRCVDLVITDVRMPGSLDGFDLVQAALATCPDLRTIVMSGFTGEQGECGSRLGLADRFLQKPFTMSFLEREVQELLAA